MCVPSFKTVVVGPPESICEKAEGQNQNKHLWCYEIIEDNKLHTK